MLKAFVLLALLAAVSAYKIVFFVPYMSNSQVQFNARVAETLAEAGHDVTMALLANTEGFEGSDVKISKAVKQHLCNAPVPGFNKKDFEKRQAALIFKDSGMFDREQLAMMRNMTGSLIEGCRMILRDKAFLKWLKDEKFDIAFSHMYNTCPIGLIHYAGIPSWVWLNSGALMDYVADYTGVPTIPSYCPPMVQESMDTMNFVERTKSFIGHGLFKIIWPRLIPNAETQIFREELDENFPDISDIARKCPLVMVNSNEIYDNPRPLLAKVVNIGGLGVGFDDAKPLTGEFKKIVDEAKGVIVFSFGSVAAAHEMPQAWKDSFLAAFRQFPDYHFLMRYVADDLKDKLPSNVHTFKWLPQKDLLLHNKTKAFITHGGYNSLQEAITAGVPLITIALFGDQPKNSMLARKHGFAVNIKKGTLSKETIVEALETLLGSDSYSKNVKRLSAMAKHKPVPAATLLVRWTEFLGEFKTLDNLTPAGQHLSFIQYHSIDSMAFLAAVLLVVLFILFKLVCLVVRLGKRLVGSVCGCNSTSQVSKDKKNK